MGKSEWDKAQIREWGYWGCRVDGRDKKTFYMKQSRDWYHQRLYLDFIAETIGFEHPGKTLMEVGIGPCGVLPYLSAGIKIGIEPLAKKFEKTLGPYWDRYGITVYDNPFERLDTKEFDIDIVFSFNVIDHSISPPEFLRKIKEIGPSDIVMQIPLRTVSTELHPSIVKEEMLDIFNNYAVPVRRVIKSRTPDVEKDLWIWMRSSL